MESPEHVNSSLEVCARFTGCASQRRWVTIVKAILFLPYLTLLVPAAYLLHLGANPRNWDVLFLLYLYVLSLGLFFRSRLISWTMIGVLAGHLMANPIRWSLTDEIKSLILWPLVGIAVGFAADWMKRSGW